MNEQYTRLGGPELPVRLTMAGDRVDQEAIDRPEGFRYHQILYVAHGSGVLEWGNKNSRTVGPHDCYFLERDTPHAYHGLEKPFTTLWISFDGTGADQLVHYCQLHGVRIAPYAAFPPLHAQILRRMTENAGADELSLLAHQAIVEFAAATRAESAGDPLTRAEAYLRQHFTRDVTLEEAAAAANMSKYRFCRSFREAYGMTPIAYVLELRIQRAKLLLVNAPQLTVRAIGEAVGFHDAAYFGKLFRRHEHTSPLAYRRLWL